jgi:hypothetical protein
MSYITDETVWPESEVSTATKALLIRFFELADLNSLEAGPLLASEAAFPGLETETVSKQLDLVFRCYETVAKLVSFRLPNQVIRGLVIVLIPFLLA